jgi:hypothetical protein
LSCSDLLRELRAAPIRVRCFGAGEAWYGDRLLQIRDPELLLLFAIHPITGIRSETLADMLWDDPPADIFGALRRERFKLRRELRRLAPEVTADPVPGNELQGEKVVALDTQVVSSDVHEFMALLEGVDKLQPAAAIEAYEAALALYRGDLLDNPRCSIIAGCTTPTRRSRSRSAQRFSTSAQRDTPATGTTAS